MNIRPLFLTRTNELDPAPTLEATADYSAYSDEQLIRERDQQQRQLEELTLHSDRSRATRSLLISIDGEVERITDELIRRARSRHPSSRGPVG